MWWEWRIGNTSWEWDVIIVDNVLVTSCWITDYPKYEWLKTRNIYDHSFRDSEIVCPGSSGSGSHRLGQGSQVSQGCNQGAGQACSHLRVWIGEDPPPRSLTWLLTRIRFLAVCWTKILSSLSTGWQNPPSYPGHISFSRAVHSVAVGFTKGSRWERKGGQDGSKPDSLLLNLGSDMPSLLLFSFP